MVDAAVDARKEHALKPPIREKDVLFGIGFMRLRLRSGKVLGKHGRHHQPKSHPHTGT